MNEELSKRLLVFLDTIEQTAGDLKEVSSEQMPLLVEEYLTYCRISVAIELAFFGLAAFVSLVSLIYFLRKKRSTDTECMMLGVSLLAFIFSSCGSIIVLIHFVKVLVAPRVILLEELRRLLS